MAPRLRNNSCVPPNPVVDGERKSLRMVHRFEFLSTARLRVPVCALLVLVFAGCDNQQSLSPESDQAVSGVEAVPELASASFAGGIPIGNFNQPITAYGATFNGAHENSGPESLVRDLAQIKAQGGKVVLALSGSPKYYLENRRFSMSKWKARLDRYRNVNFASYINDGTVIGHYMIDEPNDPANWGGQSVSPSALEEMGKYSKQLWPNLATIVRVDPKYLSSGHRYVDAAWAQYLHRRGDVGNYARTMVAEAQEKGVQLIVGLNVLKGGNPNGTPMSASEVEQFGNALLATTYPCAFINWKYTSSYMASSSIKSAMGNLRRKAENRPTKSCRA
jgi:hypothetical protein